MESASATSKRTESTVLSAENATSLTGQTGRVTSKYVAKSTAPTAVTSLAGHRILQNHVPERQNVTNVASINVATAEVGKHTRTALRPTTARTPAHRIFNRGDHTSETKDKTKRKICTSQAPS